MRYIDYTVVPWDHRIVKRLMSAVFQLTQHFIAVTQHLNGTEKCSLYS